MIPVRKFSWIQDLTNTSGKDKIIADSISSYLFFFFKKGKYDGRGTIPVKLN